jgi:hypothetical protein
LRRAVDFLRPVDLRALDLRAGRATSAPASTAEAANRRAAATVPPSLGVGDATSAAAPATSATASRALSRRFSSAISTPLPFADYMKQLHVYCVHFFGTIKTFTTSFLYTR